MRYTKDSELVQTLHRATICDHCSADAIAGMLNEHFATHPHREWTAADVTDKQAEVLVDAVNDCMASGDWGEGYWHRDIVASVCNIMGVARPQRLPAVDVGRLARAIGKAICQWDKSDDPAGPCGDIDLSIAEVLRRELPAATAEPASEWPADAPDWADWMMMSSRGFMFFYGVCAASADWAIKSRHYTGSRPASWAGKPWHECVLRRPGGGV